MTDKWGHHRRTEPPEDAGAPVAELVYFTIGAVALTIAAVACYVDHAHQLPVSRGVYAILVGLFVVGADGWAISRSVARAEARVRHNTADDLAAIQDELAGVAAALAGLTSAVSQMRQEVAKAQVTYISAASRRAGSPPLSAVVGGPGDAVPPRRGSIGLDPETIANARAVARLIIDGPTGDIPVRRDGE